MTDDPPPAGEVPAEKMTPPGDRDEDRLGRLRRELYAKEESDEITKRAQALTADIQRRRLRPMTPVETARPTQFADVFAQRRGRRRQLAIWVLLGAGGIVLAGGAVMGTWWYRARHNVTERDIYVTVSAQPAVVSGDVVTFTAEYRNDSLVDWQDVEVVFTLPDGWLAQSVPAQSQSSGRTVVVPVGALARGSPGKAEVTGSLIGELNAAFAVQGELFLTPVNFPSGRFSKVSVATMTVTAVPLDLAVDAGAEAAAGERLKFAVQVRNTSSVPLKDGYLKLVVPFGMRLDVSDPEFSPQFSVVEGGWRLPVIAPGETDRRVVILTLEGSAGEQRVLTVEGGLLVGESRYLQRAITHVVTVSASELTVEQLYNDSQGPLVVRPGEAVQGVIRYRNSGTVGLRDVVVRVAFEDPVLDEATLDLEAGAYISATKTITWTSASVAELKLVQPQQGGDLKFSFAVFPARELAKAEVKNQTMAATATVDSADIRTPVGQEKRVIAHRFLMPVATAVEVRADALFDDGRLGLKSTGPLPPTVNETTTYTVRFRLGSAVNDVGDVRLLAVVPEGVRPTGQMVVTTGTADFNERSGELTWEVPLLEAGVGFTAPAAELHWQVAITPAAHQVGEVLPLLKSVAAEGTDVFADVAVGGSVADPPDTDDAAPRRGEVTV